jgi:hypothetical protein
MVDIETFLRAADAFEKPSRDQYRHYFNGANFLLYSLGETAAEREGDRPLAARLRYQYEMAVARLQAAAGLQVSPIYREGRLAEVKVRVLNLRAGHNLPTHLTNLRQLWLEVSATDPKGVSLLASGRLDGQGQLEPETRTFGSTGLDAGFQPALDPWVVRSLARNDTVPPRGYRDAYFGVSSAPNEGLISVRVRLRYRQGDPRVIEDILRSLPQGMDLKTLYGMSEIPSPPVVDMAVQEAVFQTRE